MSLSLCSQTSQRVGSGNETSDGYRLSNQAIIHHLQNLTKKPIQSSFEIEEKDKDGRSKKHGNKRWKLIQGDIPTMYIDFIKSCNDDPCISFRGGWKCG